MKPIKKFVKLAVLVFLVSANQMAAHGEHKPGPHGGAIRMPGAFHTEVLPYQNLGFKVYLLDINFENPTSKIRSYKVRLYQMEKNSLENTGHPDHFYCEIPKGSSILEGELILSPEWNFQKGAEVRYKLPLSEVKEEKKEHHHG